jgi:hypothetical protein
MNIAACSSDSWVPVSSQAIPRPKSFDLQLPALEVLAVHIGDLKLTAR